MDKIFAPSEEVVKLLLIIDQENVTLEEIAKIIEKDKNLCIRFLRLANSPVFGFSRRITKIIPSELELAPELLLKWVSLKMFLKLQ
ncbi:MAG: hypothetical protein C0169_06130 [Thermodesulfobacterium geofontis]|nr:MAG: hypothetical protein C0169_06130 [Thermodesulfobacterium geofontis]